MDVALVFFLPLVAGYIFSASWNVTKFRVAREDGHKLYFRAAFYAAFLFATAYLLRLLLLASLEGYAEIEQVAIGGITPLLKDPKPAQGELAVVAAYALVLGSTLWVPLNVVFRAERSLRRAAEANDLERVLLQALECTMPVCVTTESGKVYVGLVYLISGSGEERAWISMLPLMSGYRRAEDKSLVFTTYYDQIYKDSDPATGRLPSPLGHLTREDFQIVLPVSNIATLNLFDLEAYEAFQRTGAVKRSQEGAKEVGTDLSTGSACKYVVLMLGAFMFGAVASTRVRRASRRNSKPEAPQAFRD